MAFRDYEDIEVKCITCNSQFSLQNTLNEMSLIYDFIDLQYSTHYDSYEREERYSALLLVKKKRRAK